MELDQRPQQGMVHISEVANTFVNEIKDHLTEGQTVKVKGRNLGDDGRFRFPSRRLSLRHRKPRGSRYKGGRGQT